MELEFWATTDVGRVRDHNEDNFLVDKRMNLFVVCDGMGGHAAGEVASAMSVRVVREVLSGHREVFEELQENPELQANRDKVRKLIEHAIQEACARVYRAAQEDASQRGMGTTCSMLLLAEGRGFIGHVGDSRIYLYRDEQIHQITDDHSLINEMIRLGKIKPGEEVNLPHKNAVTRAVGVNEFVEVDTFDFPVFGGDSFLVCSDGLSGYFKTDSQISDLLEQEDVKKITEDCIDFANAGGGKDNITSIVIRVTSDSEETIDLQRTMEVMRTTPYFQYLAYKEMVQMINLAKRVEVPVGEKVFASEEDPAGMYLLVRGEVVLRENGKALKKLEFGDHFGEISLVDDMPRSVEAEAVQDVVVLYFPRDRFMGLLRKEPGLAVKLLWNFLQAFTIRMREIPYEMLIGAATPGEHDLDAPTPPSGTLLEGKLLADSGHQPASVSGEFVAPTPEQINAAMAESERADSLDLASDPSEPALDVGSEPTAAEDSPEVDLGATIKTQPARPVKRKREAAANPAKTDPTGKIATVGGRAAVSETAPTLRSTKSDDSLKASQMQSFGDPDATMDMGDELDLAWDDIVPGDLLGEDDIDESLRQTLQMEQEPEERKLAIPTADAGNGAGDSVDADDFRETIPSGANNGLGKPISGESVTKNSTPQAQVLKRTKLVVGQRNDFKSGDEHTRDVDPLTPRKPDTTLELDIEDDSVEEIN